MSSGNAGMESLIPIMNKMQDIFTHVYDVRDTVFSDQTGRFPTQSQAGHKYLMVVVDIDSSAILVEPIKSRKDAEERLKNQFQEYSKLRG